MEKLFNFKDPRQDEESDVDIESVSESQLKIQLKDFIKKKLDEPTYLIPSNLT